jgi:hypothetical protein
LIRDGPACLSVVANDSLLRVPIVIVIR